MATKKAPVKKAAAKVHRIDWEAVERDYRTGKFTLRELETKHNASYSQISRRAKQQNWQKDLAEVVRQATNAALLHETATKAQSDATTVVAVAAELNKQVILRHRSDISEMRDLAMELLAEIRLATHSPADLQALLRLATTGAEDESDLAAVQQSFRDMIKIHSRVTSVHKLSDTLNKLQTLERRAFGLGDGEGDDKAKQPGAGSPVQLTTDELLDIARGSRG